MPKANHQKNFFFIATISLLIITATILVSLLARGYKLNINNGIVLSPSGLLSLTSNPKPASVFINDRLVTATDDTLNLPPGIYDIKINKDGYLPWQKTLTVKKEVVSPTDAHLFRSAPILEPLSLSGAINPSVSPDKSKIAFAVASASATTNNGLYLAELNNSLPLGTRNTPKLIKPNTFFIDWTQAQSFTFSPDSSQILITFSNANYLIDLTNLNKPLYDITAQLPLIMEEWQQKEEEIIQTRLSSLPPQIIPFISTQSASHIQISPDKDKVLYLASIDGNLEANIITPPPSQSTQPQQRQIKSGFYYIYDIKQDTNFEIGDLNSIENPFWLPNSQNIVFAQQEKINVVEYDNTNKHTLFVNKLKSNIIAAWADGAKLVTLTTAYSGAQDNLYTIVIK